MSPDCPGLRDIAALSANYATLTGVLAGFAFTAIVILLTPLDRKRAGGDILLPLLVAFVALIIATLSYSLLAGDSTAEARGRTATVELITGVPFGLAVIMLFQGIAKLLHAGNVHPVAVRTAYATAVVITPTMTLYYIAAGASELDTAGQSCAHGDAPLLGEILTLVLAIVLSVSMLRRVQPRGWRLWAQKAHNAVPVSVLVVCVIAAIAGRAIGTGSPGFTLSPAALNAYIATTFTLLGVLGVMLALGRPESQPLRLETTS